MSLPSPLPPTAVAGGVVFDEEAAAAASQELLPEMKPLPEDKEFGKNMVLDVALRMEEVRRLNRLKQQEEAAIMGAKGREARRGTYKRGPRHR